MFYKKSLNKQSCINRAEEGIVYDPETNQNQMSKQFSATHNDLFKKVTKKKKKTVQIGVYPRNQKWRFDSTGLRNEPIIEYNTFLKKK